MLKIAERPQDAKKDLAKDAKKPGRPDARKDGLKAALAPPKLIAAVDLGASKVACFIMKPDGVRRGDRTLTTCGVGYVQSRGIRGGAIVNLDESSEAIAQAVRERGIAHVGGERGRLTVSIGVAHMDHVEGEDTEGLLRRADSALYRAKSRGRDRVEVDDRLPLRDATPLRTVSS